MKSEKAAEVGAVGALCSNHKIEITLTARLLSLGSQPVKPAPIHEM